MLSDAVTTVTPLTGSDLAVWNAAFEADEEVSSSVLQRASGRAPRTFHNAADRLCKTGRLLKRKQGKNVWYSLPAARLC